jgi:hypothetical protein
LLNPRGAGPNLNAASTRRLRSTRRPPTNRGRPIGCLGSPRTPKWSKAIEANICPVTTHAQRRCPKPREQNDGHHEVERSKEPAGQVGGGTVDHPTTRRPFATDQEGRGHGQRATDVALSHHSRLPRPGHGLRAARPRRHPGELPTGGGRLGCPRPPLGLPVALTGEPELPGGRVPRAPRAIGELPLEAAESAASAVDEGRLLTRVTCRRAGDK